MKTYIAPLSAALFLFTLTASSGLYAEGAPLYRMEDNVRSHWVSFENPDAAKGSGGTANGGAKGAAFQVIKAGEEKVLMDVSGSGLIHRMWCTLPKRSPRDLRSFVLRMYWDQAAKPAVEVPFGDFFGAILGEVRPFHNDLFSSPEGRSFNFTIPMPFQTHARITFTNESDEDLPQFFYDINYSEMKFEEKPLYFHAVWHRERYTELRRDFEILPRTTGKGRYLGTHLGIIGHPDNLGWWGEGEVKIYLDGDTALPTLIGTGTEDYVGTGYFQGEFAHPYQGSLLIDNVNQYWTMYRYHIPDPVFFHQDIRVTIQQIGGAMQEYVKEMLSKGVEILPISVGAQDGFVPLLESEPPRSLNDPGIPYGWTNFYRRDDVCAVAFFYLDAPENQAPPISPLAERLTAIGERRDAGTPR
ncbi:MAG TPA: DUF2961 domain-containing protein [Candidatus Hydrogenedentes bacterium]|jgi:hypothetical protein|nr:DUF2961 domain-containing protein [Candidatus Hydrogenedentota bacterium]HQB03109.1 DUF2961 domain-containing protein [Candidatus Hydrogenedentota bacterium]